MAMLSKFVRSNLAHALLVASMLSLALGIARQSSAIAASKVPFPGTVSESGNGQFEIAVWSNGTWQAAGKLAYDQFISEQYINLASFAQSDLVQVRVTHLGKSSAQIDAVTLGGRTPINTQGASESPALVAKKLAQRDYDLLDVSGKSIVFTFAKNSSSALALVARIEPANMVGLPFQFPSSNNYTEVGETSQFYSYRLNSAPGALNINGDLNDEKLGKPFFKVWTQPVSGHPADFTYGWVLNDANNLYVAIDFAPDNTWGDSDYTAVYVKTTSGVQRFQVTTTERQWGIPGFVYDERAMYQHKVYEYQIPLTQIGFNAGRNDIVELAFEAYGSAALVTLTSSLNPSTFGQNVTFTATFDSTGVPLTFTDNGNNIPGCININTGANKFATCSTSGLTIGNHTIQVPNWGPTQLLQVVNAAPREVPEADTLLLLSGGMGGLATWVGWQFKKRRAKK